MQAVLELSDMVCYSPDQTSKLPSVNLAGMIRLESKWFQNGGMVSLLYSTSFRGGASGRLSTVSQCPEGQLPKVNFA